MNFGIIIYKRSSTIYFLLIRVDGSNVRRLRRVVEASKGISTPESTFAEAQMFAKSAPIIDDG